MKVAALHRAMLTTEAVLPVFVHTGQHYDWEMSDVFLRELGLPAPDAELGVGSGSHAEQTAQVMIRLEQVLLAKRPDVVVVVGDVNSTLAAALAAAKMQIPVAHVEAGLRSFDRSMPEEINRLVTDAVSDMLFAPSTDAVQNLLHEGVPHERIHLVGNVMIDTLERLLPTASRSDVLERLGLEGDGFLLATFHRPSNVDTDGSIKRVAELLVTAARTLPVVLVAHPRTARRLEEAGLTGVLEASGVLMSKPLGYLDFLRLMSS